MTACVSRFAVLPALPILAALIAVTSQARAQSLQWQRNPANGRWYAESAAPTTWTGAEALAQSLGSHLATVRSQSESDWLDQHFFSQLVLFRHHWIGLRQDRLDPAYSEPAGGWGWASGEPLTFTNWAPGQPDNAGGQQDFGRSGGNTGGSTQAWHDETDLAQPGFGGALDLYIGAGQVVVFDTASGSLPLSTIQFAPGTNNVINVTPQGVQSMPGGVVQIDDLVIELGGVLQVVGPNGLVVMARGRIVLAGKLDANGFSSNGVSTLNTTSIPEPGAAGRAGGGSGGTGSPLTTASSPAGGSGFGAFGRPDGGGGGGETAWSSVSNQATRRGAGGGGGRLGADVLAGAGTGQFEQRRIGYDAEKGFDNLLAQNGALPGQTGAQGGAIGASPFVDASSINDFYGRSLDRVSGAVVVGELVRPWAGAGGGAGGDAAFVPTGTFPAPFVPTGDEKGAGGGGGGGSVHILAEGPIVFGASGQVLARGGYGGGGENTIFLNRIGGGSGGGSGGHVVLQSSSFIDLRARQAQSWSSSIGVGYAIDTRGGQGGAGADDIGGAFAAVGGQTETPSSTDACPPGYPRMGSNACRGHVNSAGGDGGPGIVQLHTPQGLVGTDPLTADILLPLGVTFDLLSAPMPTGLTPGSTSYLQPDIGDGVALIELDSDDCDADGVPDSYQITLEPGLDTDRDGILDSCDSSIRYCAQPAPAGCDAALDSIGLASASASTGFELVVSSVAGRRSGQLFYGLAPTAIPFGVGLRCVAQPNQRMTTLNSGGTLGACDGELRLDWNAWRSANPTALGAPFSVGQVFYSQAWFREFGGAQATLSNALRFTLAP